jgi:hypothetical protein
MWISEAGTIHRWFSEEQMYMKLNTHSRKITNKIMIYAINNLKMFQHLNNEKYKWGYWLNKKENNILEILITHCPIYL